jgi:Flp pilus assembly protein TadG
MSASEAEQRIRRRKAKPTDSGQALVEFAISVAVLLTLVFAVIDFGRAIHDAEVLKNLTGEGSAMASRGTVLSDTATAVVAAAAPLDLNDSGRVIVTSVLNNNNSLKITGQASQGGIAALSKVGNTVGGAANLPAGAAPQANQTVYVTEVFYNFRSITPIGKFLGKNILPSQLYDVAYY